jgi:hypothetical protein
MSTWKPSGPGIWTRIYDFGGNPLNTSAIDIGEGRLLVLSPGTGLEEADYAALDAIGTVTALLPPGPFHNMGLAAWKERYPNAELYGNDACITHIAKAHPALVALKPLADLLPLLPEGFVIEDHGGMGKPDLFFALTRDGETTWFTNELLTNNADWPAKFPFKVAFWVFNSGPGLNCNTLALKLVKGNKAGARSYLEGKLAQLPPTRLVPCHGLVMEAPDLASTLGEVIARRL